MSEMWVYELVARNLMKWSASTRQKILDKLSSSYDRKLVLKSYTKIKEEKHESPNI